MIAHLFYKWRVRLLSIFALSALLLTSACITEDVPANTRQGNFEALWSTLDAHYCFFPEKAAAYGLNWEEVHSRYGAQISEAMTEKQLFEVLANMTYELRDGHVNLYAAHNTARYGRWFDDFPTNYSDSLERQTLGRTEDYRTAAGLKYRILPSGEGYLRVASFATEPGSGNLSEVMNYLARCSALIVDIRNNGGGMMTAAEKLAGLFINADTLGGTMRHKTGAAHDAFSSPTPITLKPFEGLRWQKPVAVLTNRRTYSAANTFVMFVKGLPNVTIVGDRTGGGAGMPFTSELPNGWLLRFSASPTADRHGCSTESGIDPDVKQDITPDDYARGYDAILERAKEVVR